ncbi:hypothetical protein ACIGZH_05845 [Streptomyces sp. NPDC058319]|uniref:hypothetical protein n=1 Tax=unclassified Streptomyces TaxID=2593676 RepID=UPI0007DE0A9F|nr:hypothetical protein [Streptomyces sp. SAT1]ANH90055.1 hypothetical protein A8713_01990 [Streptomyces sp. SAT1]
MTTGAGTPARRVLRTPRAAGLAGILFALLLAAAIVLIRLGIPEGAEAAAAPVRTDPARRDAVRAALALVPLAGILFLWFTGVVRTHVGAAEDKFLATVFLGSGLVFVATMFGAAAAASAVVTAAHPSSGAVSSPATREFGRRLAHELMTGYAMRMAAVFTCSLSVMGHRLRILPRWLTVLGLLAALTLLFASSTVPWAELVFPAWALVLSAYILAVAGRAGPAAATAD